MVGLLLLQGLVQTKVRPAAIIRVRLYFTEEKRI
jgi:hypothetical protein